jgi:hypothetical protein
MIGKAAGCRPSVPRRTTGANFDKLFEDFDWKQALPLLFVHSHTPGGSSKHNERGRLIY